VILGKLALEFGACAQRNGACSGEQSANIVFAQRAYQAWLEACAALIAGAFCAALKALCSVLGFPFAALAAAAYTVAHSVSPNALSSAYGAIDPAFHLVHIGAGCSTGMLR
jgi:hypothetical protein